MTKRGFGQLRRLPSKRYQAFYTGPDTALHYGPSTFETKLDAEAWLTDERRVIASGLWIPPKGRTAAALAALPPSLTDYAAGWLESRTLKPRKLSEIHVVGGQQFGISGGAALPAEVAAALNVLEDHLRNIDRLQADETELEDWRADEAAALATQAASMAAQPAARSRNLYE